MRSPGPRAPARTAALAGSSGKTAKSSEMGFRGLPFGAAAILSNVRLARRCNSRTGKDYYTQSDSCITAPLSFQQLLWSLPSMCTGRIGRPCLPSHPATPDINIRPNVGNLAPISAGSSLAGPASLWQSKAPPCAQSPRVSSSPSGRTGIMCMYIAMQGGAVARENGEKTRGGRGGGGGCHGHMFRGEGVSSRQLNGDALERKGGSSGEGSRQQPAPQHEKKQARANK